MATMTMQNQLPQTSYQTGFSFAEQAPQQHPHIPAQLAQHYVPTQIAQQFVPPQVAQQFVPKHIAQQFVPPQIAEQIAVEVLRTQAAFQQMLGQQSYGQQNLGQQGYVQQQYGPLGHQAAHQPQQNPWLSQAPQYAQYAQFSGAQQHPQMNPQGGSWLSQLSSSPFGQLRSSNPQF